MLNVSLQVPTPPGRLLQSLRVNLSSMKTRWAPSVRIQLVWSQLFWFCSMTRHTWSKPGLLGGVGAAAQLIPPKQTLHVVFKQLLPFLVRDAAFRTPTRRAGCSPSECLRLSAAQSLLRCVKHL
ncbi:hypothetical protein EYF80_003437 [Liparis tanakae]|uniref:Uncharacterized protein n=1 Tax=Liparis tanakae TaxID=230148 RepID=A0A4Z2JAD0_9TELE|nr:hypothetical protein EYF80_003437 [Liparis tanakae]